MKHDGQHGRPKPSGRGLNSVRGADPADFLRLAKEKHREGRLAAAEKLYVRAIVAVPADAKEAHYRLGVLYLQTARTDRAIGQFRSAARLDPSAAIILAGLGNAFLSANRLADAVAAYRQALALRPTFAEAHFNLANALRQQGNLADAVGSYGRAISLSPAALHAHINLGATFQEMGDYARAEKAFRDALALNPRSFEAHFNLGVLLDAQGKIEGEIAAYRDALEINPDIAAAHTNLGKLLDGQGRTDEAILCYERAVALDASLSAAYNNLGLALAGQGRLEDAIAAHRKALELEPEAPWLNVNLATVLTQKHDRNDADTGLLDEAIQYCRRAMALDASHVEAHRILGVALRRRGLTGGSFATFRRHAELKYGALASEGAADPIRPYKLRHDREQLEYLLKNKIVDMPDAARRLASMPSETPQVDPLADVFHIEGGERISSPAVNPKNDTTEIETR